MAIKLYVGNVPQSARNSELKELFEKFGKVVECDILKDFAFVHMEDTNDVKAAIAGLNDSLWKGSRIRVELSTTKTNKGQPSSSSSFSSNRSNLRRGNTNSRDRRDSGVRNSRSRIQNSGGGGSYSSLSSSSSMRDNSYRQERLSSSSSFPRSRVGNGGPMRENRFGNGRSDRGRPYPETFDYRNNNDNNQRNYFGPRDGGLNFRGGPPPRMHNFPFPIPMPPNVDPFRNNDHHHNNRGFQFMGRGGEPFMRPPIPSSPPMHNNNNINHHHHHLPPPPPPPQFYNDYFRGPPMPSGPPMPPSSRRRHESNY